MPDESPEPQAIDFSSAELLHQQLARILARRILSGELPPGSPLSERGLSLEYGVARPTVRSCLYILGAQGLVRRVPRKGAVVADVKPARAPFSTIPVILVREGQTHRLNPSDSPWYFDIYSGIQSMANELGYQVRKDVLRQWVQVPLRDYVPPKPSEASGAILYGTYDERYIGMFRSEGIPLVAVDYWTQDLVTDCVTVDVEAEASVLVDFLANKGHVSLGFVAVGRTAPGGTFYEFDPDVRRLLDGLRRAAEPRGIDLRDEWALLVDDPAQLPRAVEDHLGRQSPRPTAFVCFEQRASRCILEVAGRLGLRCPEDFSLVNRGTERVEGLAVTSTIADARQMGRTAARLLAERMHGLRSHVAKLALPPRLVLGTTTGPAPQARR